MVIWVNVWQYHIPHKDEHPSSMLGITTKGVEMKEDVVENIPSKEVRQKLFIEQCKKEGLTAREIVERASVFPFDKESKVLKWPKL